MALLIKTGEEHLRVDAAVGRALDEVLLEAGVLLNKRCGGSGRCGACRVSLEQGRFVVEREDTELRGAAREVLACRTTIAHADGVVCVPDRSMVEDAGAIDDEFSPADHVALDPSVRRLCIELEPAGADDPRSSMDMLVDALALASDLAPIEVTLPAARRASALFETGCRQLRATLSSDGRTWSLVDVAPHDGTSAVYGVALDIGTTTVVGALVDLGRGRVIGKASRYNQQITLAADVASRISVARGSAEIKRLQGLVATATINPIIDELCAAHGVARDDVQRLAVAGNTVMTHLLLGLHVRSIGKLPFRPTLHAPACVPAALLGIRAGRHALVDFAPGVSGYIGGDIVATLATRAVDTWPDGTLLIDIGTNAEVVLKSGEELVCCAAPAGPAFEGGGLRDGCLAVSGAIERIRISPDMQIELGVIGGGEPLGICGSAVIDFIAEGRKGGWINACGRFDVARLKRSGRYESVEIGGRTSHACVLADATADGARRSIVVSEADVAEILQAKAALAAAVRTLLEVCGTQLEEVPRVVLAGGFARRIDLERAIAIGLLPPLPVDRFEKIGNGALAGACRALIDRATLDTMRRMHRRPRTIELNRVPSFEGHFIDSLRLPETPAPVGLAGRTTAEETL